MRIDSCHTTRVNTDFVIAALEPWDLAVMVLSAVFVPSCGHANRVKSK